MSSGKNALVIFYIPWYDWIVAYKLTIFWKVFYIIKKKITSPLKNKFGKIKKSCWHCPPTVLIYRHIKITAKHKTNKFKKVWKKCWQSRTDVIQWGCKQKMFKKHCIANIYSIEPWQLKSNNSAGWNARVHSKLCYDSKNWKSLDDRTYNTMETLLL